MGNVHRGEVSLVAGDNTHVIRFTMNSICQLEDCLGKPVTEIAALLQNPSSFRMGMARAILWAGLLDKNPEVTLETAGDIATDVGIPACMNAIGKAFSLAFPSEQKEVEKRPQKAATD
ncbi:GTA-gp10 family protein [Rhizobium leguminosarum]|uniref:GTA-gp10 family protein n=1 Tax=Rhizobium leguminosarum TaxID=384 RepID=UPI003CFC572E